MLVNRLQTTLLTITGLIALSIGSLIAMDPMDFYSSYGITLAGNTDMLSELRAPGANLAVLGAVILMGAWRKSMRQVSLLIGLIVFGAFAAGRFLGLLTDGIPSDKVLAALLIELIAALLLAMTYFATRRAQQRTYQ